MLKKAGTFILHALSIIALLSIWYGYSSLIHITLIYASITILSLNLFKPGPNGRLVVWSLFVSILFIELGLSFFSPHERFSYINSNKKNSLKEILSKTFYPQSDIHFHSGQSNSSFNYVSSGEFSYLHEYNSLGLREKEPLETSEANKVDILALGDSFTEGAGAPIDSTWVSVLKNLGKQEKLSVINGGSISSDILFEYYKLNTKLYDLYHPNQLILSINKTDISDFMENGGLDRFEDPQHLSQNNAPWWSALFTFSPLSRYIFINLFNLSEYGSTEEELKLIEASMRDIEETILLFQKHAQTNKYNFMLVIIPLKEELEAGTLRLENLDEFCEKHDIPVFNFYDYQRIHKLEYQDYYWENDGHLNPKGYVLLGHLVYDEVQNKMHHPFE